MKISAATLATALADRTGRTAAPVLLHDYVAELAIEVGYASSLNSALEVVEPLLPKVRITLAHLQAEAEQNGTTWAVELFGSDDEWIRGSSFEDSSLDPTTRGIRARRAYVAEVKAQIVELTASEFERACTRVLKALGCNEPYTSPIRNDGGIDFYGRLTLKGRLDTPLPLGGLDDRAGVWLIGQAKHYPTRPIQTAVLRELVGSVELARTGGAIHSWNGLTLRPFDAVLLLVFTTGWFSAGSLALLEQSGVLAMNGDQLATLLCDAGLGFPEEKPPFVREVFRDELLG